MADHQDQNQSFPTKKRLKRDYDVEGDEVPMKKIKNSNSTGCWICGKIFSSKNALGGHMRTHLQVHTKNTSNQSESSLDVGGEEDRDTETSDLGCENLRLEEKGIRVFKDEDIRALFRPWNDEKKSEFLLKFVNVKTDSKLQEGIVEQTDTSVGENMSMSNIGSETNNFKCYTCGKSFSSHQALGGHRSSHYKRNKEVRETAALNNNTVAEEEIRKGDVVVEGGHQCKICGKSFSTGQALGGHKRRHWIKPLVVEAPAVSSSIVEALKDENDVSHLVSVTEEFEFDLNEMPRKEEEPTLTLLPLLVS